MENRPATLADSAQRRARLLTTSGALLVSAAACFLIAAPAAVAPGHTLAAFLLFLLGVSVVTLALVADRFPGAASLAAAIASALDRYLFGGGN